MRGLQVTQARLAAAWYKLVADRAMAALRFRQGDQQPRLLVAFN
jgi:hypothetical protein